MICTGYVGCEAFDVVLYISRTLTKLNYRVLIIDLSASEALHKSINHGMGLNSLEEIVNYRDVNYTRKIPLKEELETFQGGVVFIIYGDDYRNEDQLECQSFNIVVNTFPHMIDRINSLLQNVLGKKERIRLLIRDIVTIDDVDRVKRAMLPIKTEKVSYLYYDVTDYENAINCQITQVIRFNKITSRMEKYIIEQIHDLLPELKITKIKRAMTVARKGV